MSDMTKWLRCLGLASALSLEACDDGVVILSFNSGVIVGPPRCDRSGGEFQMQTEGGLTILVVITDDTSIVVAGTGGTCSDLFADVAVQVSGHRSSDDVVVASSITVE
jgi:hypothetical protein